MTNYVFVVEQRVRHEGSGIMAVFSTKEAALENAKSRAVKLYENRTDSSGVEPVISGVAEGFGVIVNGYGWDVAYLVYKFPVLD